MTGDPIRAYIASFLALDHPILAQLSEQEKTHPEVQRHSAYRRRDHTEREGIRLI